MGFSGFFVLAQTDALVDRLEGVPGLDAVAYERSYGDGWRLAQLAESAGKLVQWAREAGLTASPEALAAAMAGEVGPFGEGVHDLVLALGVRAS